MQIPTVVSASDIFLAEIPLIARSTISCVYSCPLQVQEILFDFEFSILVRFWRTIFFGLRIPVPNYYFGSDLVVNYISEKTMS